MNFSTESIFLNTAKSILENYKDALATNADQKTYQLSAQDVLNVIQHFNKKQLILGLLGHEAMMKLFGGVEKTSIPTNLNSLALQNNETLFSSPSRTDNAICPSANMAMQLKNEEPEVAAESTTETSENNIVSTTIEFSLGTAILKTNLKDRCANLTIFNNMKAIEILGSVEVKQAKASGKHGSLTSAFIKNYPKKLGDEYAKFLKRRKIPTSNAFKDKTSLKTLNKYLEGELTLDGVSSDAFVKLFLEFLNDISMNPLAESKIVDSGKKECYQIITAYLVESGRIINNSAWKKTPSSIAIKKIWPSLDMDVKWSV